MKPFWLFVIFLLWGGGMTPIAIMLAERYGMMDYPDQRKIHHDPVPRGAGLVLWSGLLMWALLFARVSFELRIIVTGATIVFFAGYVDDMLSLSPLGRLVVHFLAAAVSLLMVGRQDALHMGVLLFWVAGVTNAYNFIDGINGLALSMAFLSLSFIGWMSASTMVMPVIAMIAGIFFWNFPRARTFLGDGGVYLLGYFTAAVTMLWLLPMNLGIYKFCALLLFIGGVPVIDTLAAIIRRAAAGKSPFYPDRSHIHHRLLDKGLSPFGVLAVLSFLQIISLSCAYLLLRL
ncbi:MAG: MraY family glycosyltransferase [Pyramidobacter sp.]|uniref:glycosyltransferase family 4 protein n=1 Tax=unclassified Pyramidobacter TaxID=2632171 RepID=UPI000EA1912F|nr:MULTISPECIES: MraY family glycosyltransferase [unclassified Pyramidobacter]MDY3212128.1 MraY family glycosyltransferase [Pyramidobacter sp.]MDY4032907.1 MraY family glycosyltransferase [Pyramidobacter sp.]RKJ80399.1 undecaprenyl/decaprenyl-phosphate alpha-N-acetylglucosaminyl 1-phosphate transferase [Pyramidobacter sp. CG50-2]WOL38839.1 MraY family glycosyltransferase [Pyramidobacter sp. YE332]